MEIKIYYNKLILRALKHNSKDCEFNLEINIKGFKFSFKRKEYSHQIAFFLKNLI